MTKDKKPKVAIYCRVSSEDQKEKASIEAQVDYLEAWASKEGMDIVGRYIDDGFSGKDMQRPDMQQLLKDIPMKRFKGIIAYHNDRVFRNTKDQLTFAELCKDNKVWLRFGNIDIDTTTPEGEVLFTMMGAFAQYFRRDLGRKTSLGMQKRKKNGKWMGQVSKYFIKKEDGSIEPKPIAWGVYGFSKTMSLRAIAKKLKIPKTAVSRIINNMKHLEEIGHLKRLKNGVK